MQQQGALYRPEMKIFLADFSIFDAPMMATEYLRRVLLFVYANTPAQYRELPAERRLALRLLSRSAQIASQFASLLTQEIRGSASSPVRSNNVHRLSKRIYANTRDEAAALERILRKERPDFQILDSAFDATRYAHCLEAALNHALDLTPAEKDVIFRSWSGLFAETVRETYVKYIQVLLNGSELAPQAQQDFVDTIPFSIENRLDLQPRPNPAISPA